VPPDRYSTATCTVLPTLEAQEDFQPQRLVGGNVLDRGCEHGRRATHAGFLVVFNSYIWNYKIISYKYCFGCHFSTL